MARAAMRCHTGRTVCGRQGMRVMHVHPTPAWRLGLRRNCRATAATQVRSRPVSPEAADVMVRPSRQVDEWFFTESGQKNWVRAMELDSLTPDLPTLLLELGINYDPDRLAAHLSKQWPKVYGRAVRIAASLGGFIAQLGQDYALGRVEQQMPKRAAQLTKLLSGLGPSFVKIGQALSARPDLLPQPYLEALSTLQDRLPSFPNEIAFAVIEEELGRPVEEVYMELSEVPVAAASLGQVYKARLRETGEVVAVKVQRPGIGESIAVDMLLLRRLMAVVDRNLPQISQPLVPLVDEFAGRLFAELDYVQEGKNCERFQELYGSMPRVRTPRIYWPYTARRVLTMEWIEGVKLTNKAAMEGAGLDVVDFVDVGIECTLRQLLEHGYFHADPHPGNLLATRDGTLVYLDFGMMSEAPQYARYAIMSHVVHLVNRDYEAMCRDYYTLQFMDPSVDTQPIAPALQAFFDDVLDASVAELNFKAIVDGLGEVLFQYPFRVPAYYALILRSLTVLEGLALSADPGYKLLGRAYPYMARRLLTDPAPELRESFEELIIKDGSFRWNRLENLLREGSKSSDFDPAQLWLLASWLLSPNAAGVRARLASEVARMVDALAASDVRDRIAQRFGSEELANRLVPCQASEVEARQRALLLLATLSNQVGSTSTSSSSSYAYSSSSSSDSNSSSSSSGSFVGSSSSSVGSSQPSSSRPSPSSSSSSVWGQLGLPQGSGPFGLLLPQDIAPMMASWQATATSVWPQLQQLAAQPGASELARDIVNALAQRFTARVIKFAFGSQDARQAMTAALGGSGGGSREERSF